MKIFEDSGWAEVIYKSRPIPCIKDFQRVVYVDEVPTLSFIENIRTHRPGTHFFNFKVDNWGINFRVTFTCTHDSSD